MKKPQHKRFVFCLFTFAFFTVTLFQSGCGIVSLLGTPRESEKKIPAEYNLAEHKDQKILVLVNQPAYLNAQANLRFYLTEAINENLVESVGIAPDNLIAYSELSEFRSNKDDFSLLSPTEVGKALDANMVLLVVIEDYQLDKMVEIGYYKGSLSVRTALFETATGGKLWPKSAKSKRVGVGFEVESRGRAVATSRLVTASAYCLVRYFYNCPKPKFKIADDRSGVGWKDWKK